MLVSIGWIVLAIELIASMLFGYIFWHFWSNAAIPKTLAKRALAVYAFGCAVCIVLSLVLPL